MRSEELAHHGILGMKWGVRRYQNKDGSLTPKGRQRYSSKNMDKSEAKPKSKKISEMSDDELRQRISRLELEKRYRDLSPKDTNKGRDFVKRVLEKSGENIATQFTTYVLGTTVNKVFKDVFKDENIINPKKGQKDK